MSGIEKIRRPWIGKRRRVLLDAQRKYGGAAMEWRNGQLYFKGSDRTVPNTPVVPKGTPATRRAGVMVSEEIIER